MNQAELDRAIDECRDSWPTEIANAWAVLPTEGDSFVIEGPFDDAEAAHRVSIPAAGRVVYNAADADAAAMMIFNE